jgi:hypothetical protein
LKGVFKKLPFLQALFDARPEDRHAALVEVFFNFIVGTFSIWFVAFLLKVKGAQIEGRVASYFDLVMREIERGELLMITLSICSPVAYVLWRDKKSDPPFPSRGTSIYCTSIAAALSLGAISLIRTETSVNTGFVSDFSVVVFLVVLIVMFTVFVNRNFRENGAAYVMRATEVNFLAGFDDRMNSSDK